MARKPPASTPPAAPTMSVEKGLPRLRMQHVEGAGIVQTRGTEAACAAWETKTKHWLEAVFGEGSPKVRTVMHAGTHYVTTDDSDRDALARARLVDELNQLAAMIAILEDEAAEPAPRWGSKLPATAAADSGTKVFIVHGHDDGAKEMVARFVGGLDLVPVILHERASEGRTVIEKFEDHAAEAAFAVVLLTPDDRGGTAATPFDLQKGRARQNVILELGYFLAKLTRRRVCALYKEGTEVPSDFAGVVYVQIDPGGAWRLALAKELKQVFPAVDMNKALE